MGFVDLLNYNSDVSNDVGVYVLVFFRVLGFAVIASEFGDRIMPGRLTFFLTAAVSVLISPLIEWSGDLTAQAALCEISSGLVFGFIFRLLLFSLSFVGSLVAQQISLSQSLGVPEVGVGSGISNLFVMLGILILLTSGAGVWGVYVLVRSFLIVPIGIPPSDINVAAHVSNLFFGALVFALPFVILSVLFHAFMGVLNRLIPALMVVMIGAPGLILLGLVLLIQIVSRASLYMLDYLRLIWQ